MKASNCPLSLWDYCAERCAVVNNCTAKDLFQLQGETAAYHVNGQQPDISNICQFQWYEWVYWRDEKASFPFPSEALGKSLGPAINAGNSMAQWILKANGRIIPCRTCRPLRQDEVNDPIEVVKQKSFDDAI